MLPNEITLGKFSNIVKNKHTLQIHFSVYHHSITNAMTIPAANNCFYFSNLRDGIIFSFFMNASNHRRGLVLEGGAMRGLFTATF